MDFRAIVELLVNLGEFLGSTAVLATLVYLSPGAEPSHTERRQRADARMKSSLASMDPCKISEIRGRLAEELASHYGGVNTYVQNLRRFDG